MKTLIPVAEIHEQLRRQGRRDCLWCELGIAHPPYSTCPHGGQIDLNGGTVMVESSPLPAGSTEIGRFGRNNEYTLRLATTEEDRLKCWHLVYCQYLACGYAQEQDMEYRYSLHDALPDTATFLVELHGRAIGTVSVFPDSPIGLPADEIYRTDIDALRHAGRRAVEVGRLTIDKEFMNERCILTAMFDILSLYARCVRHATDLVITVNPSHETFYERMLLFQKLGQPQELSSVCGASAVLLRLDLSFQRKVIRHEHGEGPKPEAWAGGRTFYRYFSSAIEENRKVALLTREHQSPAPAFIHRYFVWLKPLIPQLTSSLLYFFEKCYPGCDLRAA